MQHTEQNESTALSYDSIAQSFTEEAATLLPENIIEEILAEEKLRFEHAKLLQLPLSKLVGHNTLRYCKDLLRKRQPLSFLYSLLCFCTEVSIWMLLYGIIMGLSHEFFMKNSGFFTPFPFLCPLILFLALTSYKALSRRLLLKQLAIPFQTTPPAETELMKCRSTIQKNRLLSLAAVLLPTGAAFTAVYFLKPDNTCMISVSSCFFIYVACMILFGIHNIIYSSHWISFFTLGSLILFKRPKEIITSTAAYYLNMSYQQLLSKSHKSLADCTDKPELMDKLKKAIRSRLTTIRTYSVLALIILIILDVICIQNMHITILAAFAGFLLLTISFLTALLATNYLIKSLDTPA